MFLNEGEKENFLIAGRVLESSKRERERERERAGERKRERSSSNVLNEGEKENKRRGVEIVVYTCVEEKNKKKKGMKCMAESEMKKGKII